MIPENQVNQAESAILRLTRKKQALEIRANRMANELNWRLFPNGGALAIDVAPAEQAFTDLIAALKECAEIDRRLLAFPEILRKGVA